MADSDKNILITPQTGGAAEPTIIFTGADNTPVTLRVLDDGTVSFEGTAGQLFSVSDGLSGTIFSVNDISGIPSIEVLDDGTVKLAEYGGIVTAPTADPGTNTTQIATTAFVRTEISTISINNQTGTTYTLVLSDSNKIIEMNNASANTLTIPPNSSVAFPVGTKIDIIQTGAGETSIAPGAGVTLNSDSDKRKINAQWAGASIVKRASDTWILIGALKT